MTSLRQVTVPFDPVETVEMDEEPAVVLVVLLVSYADVLLDADAELVAPVFNVRPVELIPIETGYDVRLDFLYNLEEHHQQ